MDLVAEGHWWRAYCLLELGDMVEADRILTPMSAQG